MSSSGRWLFPAMVLLLAILAGFAAIFSPASQKTEPLANRSIYNSESSGYRAWSLVAQKSGLTLAPWQKSFAKLDSIPDSATMLMVEPYTFSKSIVLFGEKEAESTLAWVAQGNTLVLLDNFRHFGSHRVMQMISGRTRTLAGQLPTAVTPSEAGPSTVQPAWPLFGFPRTLGIFVTRPILSRSQLGLWLNQKGQEPQRWQVILADKNKNPVLIRLPYGKGALILGTVSDLGSNGFLFSPPNDNYQFLTNLLRREGKPVLVNEYIHGYAETENLLTYLGQNTPLGVIFVQLSLGFILLLWLSMLRWTPKPAEQKPQEGVSPEAGGLAAYIQSMAGIYARSHATSLALGPQVNRIETLLRKRFRLSLEDEARLKHLLGTSPGDYSSKENSPEILLAALREARLVVKAEGRLTHRDLLRLARQLTLIEERLQYERHRTHSLPG